MAMNIITKEKKEIRWVGLPVNSLQECRRLEQEREQRLDKIRAKVSHQFLLSRNANTELAFSLALVKELLM